MTYPSKLEAGLMIGGTLLLVVGLTSLLTMFTAAAHAQPKSTYAEQLPFTVYPYGKSCVFIAGYSGTSGISITVAPMDYVGDFCLP